MAGSEGLVSMNIDNIKPRQIFESAPLATWHFQAYRNEVYLPTQQRDEKVAELPCFVATLMSLTTAQSEEASYAACCGAGTSWDCSAPQLNVFCQFDFVHVPVDLNIVPVTVLPSSMTEKSDFEDVLFSMPGRACQDVSFVGSPCEDQSRMLSLALPRWMRVT